MNFFNEFAREFQSTFITGDRWKMFVDGMGVTLFLSLFSILLGLALGILLALGKLSKYKIIRGISTTYIDIIRGTDVYKRQVLKGAWVKQLISEHEGDMQELADKVLKSARQKAYPKPCDDMTVAAVKLKKL